MSPDLARVGGEVAHPDGAVGPGHQTEGVFLISLTKQDHGGVDLGQAGHTTALP